jgi:hypothetical protein
LYKLPTALKEFLLEKLTVAHLMKKCPAFTENEDSLLFITDLITLRLYYNTMNIAINYSILTI